LKTAVSTRKKRKNGGELFVFRRLLAVEDKIVEEEMLLPWVAVESLV
jgi:hypothetical protein